MDPPRRVGLSSPRARLAEPGVSRRRSASPRWPLPAAILPGSAGYSPSRARLAEPAADPPRHAGRYPPLSCLAAPAAPAVVPPGCAGCSPSQACLAVVVRGQLHPGTSYAVSYGPTMVDGVEIWVTERDDAYLGSLSPSTQNRYFVCLLCWMVFFRMNHAFWFWVALCWLLLETVRQGWIHECPKTTGNRHIQ